MQFKLLIKKIRIKIKGSLSLFLLRFSWTFQLYNIFFPSYYSEKKAVYKGIHKYYYDLNKRKNALYCLRRNLHRIEKGISHNNPKPVFGINYIEETIKAFEIEANRNKDQKTLNWATGVLKLYFDKVDNNNKIISGCKKKFENALSDGFTYNLNYHTVADSKRNNKPNLEFVKKLLESRKSIRWFSNKKVEQDILIKVAELANSAPSACNRQPIKIHIYDNPETIFQISSLPLGATTFYKNVPVFILFIGSLDAYFSERDRHTIYVDGGLLAMNFMLALEAHGLSSCPINWPDIASKNKKLARIIGLEDYEKCVMCLAVGYADENQIIPLSIRKTVSDLVLFNRFIEN